MEESLHFNSIAELLDYIENEALKRVQESEKKPPRQTG
jgi:hypothetical protein